MTNSTTGASSVSDTAEREIVLTRLFEAPRERVFQAWTDPDQLIRWWGPKGFTNTFHAIDVRPGGTWRFTMHGPDGTDYPNLIVYNEIVAPERISYTLGTGEPGDPDLFESTVLFVERDGRTEVTLRTLFPSVEACRQIRAFATEGGNSTLDCLAELLAADAG